MYILNTFSLRAPITIMYIDKNAKYLEIENNDTFDLVIHSKSLDNINKRYTRIHSYVDGTINGFTEMISILDSMSKCEVYYTENINEKYSDNVININSYISIEDVIDSMIIDNIQFYTRRQYMKMEKDRFKHINITLLDMTHKKSQTKFLETLNNMDPLENDTLIENIEIIDIDSFILNTKDEEIISEIMKYFNNTNQTYTYDVLHKLYTLDMYQSMYDYSKRFQGMLDNNKRVFIVRFDDVTVDVKSLLDVFSDISHQENEIIYMCDTSLAIGTERVMLYYMMLFRFIGTYKPWNNVRVFNSNGIYDSDEYYSIDRNNYITHAVQLTEHILHFSDIIVTRIKPIPKSIVNDNSRIVLLYKLMDEELVEFINRLSVNYTINTVLYDENKDNNEHVDSIHKNNGLILTWKFYDDKLGTNKNKYYPCIDADIPINDTYKNGIMVVSSYYDEYMYSIDTNITKSIYMYDIPTMNRNTNNDIKSVHMTVLLTDSTINNKSSYDGLLSRLTNMLKYPITIRLYIVIRNEQSLLRLSKVLEKVNLVNSTRLFINPQTSTLKHAIRSSHYLLTDSQYYVNYAMYYDVLVNDIFDSPYIDTLSHELLRIEMYKFKSLYAKILHIIRRDGYSMEEQNVILEYNPKMEFIL
jgi:hypothetical protein